MTLIRSIANQIGAQYANGLPFACKVKESPACRRNQTAMPAYDVWVRVGDSTRGRHVATIVFPEVR